MTPIDRLLVDELLAIDRAQRAELSECYAQLEAYRCIASVALEQLHQLTRDRDRLRAEIREARAARREGRALESAA